MTRRAQRSDAPVLPSEHAVPVQPRVSRLRPWHLAPFALVVCVLTPALVLAGQDAFPASRSGGEGGSVPAPRELIVKCESRDGARAHCPGNTAKGVILVNASTPQRCLLGTTWGFDATGVWVSDGCSGEFLFAAATAQAAPAQEPREPTERIETWGELDPGRGFLVGRGDAGELAVSAYALVRYLNQMPGEQTFTDHLGQERAVDGRNDVFPHRVIVYFKGWVGNPKLIYNIALWTVNTTDQDAIFGNIGYQFSRKFSLYGGINGNPGTRSLQGSHPYWLGHDRVMADEFFRPFFASGFWAQGEPVDGLWYNVQAGNSNSALGIKAADLDRRFTTGGSMWWMPTTKEFGPKGGYGDWEWHEDVATRFGFSTTTSREQRYTNPENGSSGNTTLRLADSVNVFDTGALAPGVTVQGVDFRTLAIDAGLKYRGVFLQTEFYTRWLDRLEADGPLPVDSIVDHGFYVQGAFFPLRQKIELYAATSQIFGDKDAGFSSSSEYLVGMNFYPTNVRNHRVNLQLIDVNRSPVSSTFGYYVGGQHGTTFSAAISVFF